MDILQQIDDLVVARSEAANLEIDSMDGLEGEALDKAIQANIAAEEAFGEKLEALNETLRNELEKTIDQDIQDELDQGAEDDANDESGTGDDTDKPEPPQPPRPEPKPEPPKPEPKPEPPQPKPRPVKPDTAEEKTKPTRPDPQRPTRPISVRTGGDDGMSKIEKWLEERKKRGQ